MHHCTKYSACAFYANSSILTFCPKIQVLKCEQRPLQYAFLCQYIDYFSVILLSLFHLSIHHLQWNIIESICLSCLPVISLQCCYFASSNRCPHRYSFYQREQGCDTFSTNGRKDVSKERKAYFQFYYIFFNSMIVRVTVYTVL